MLASREEAQQTGEQAVRRHLLAFLLEVAILVVSFEHF